MPTIKLSTTNHIAWAIISIVILILGIIFVKYYNKNYNYSPALPDSTDCPKYFPLKETFKISFDIFKNWNSETLIPEFDLKISQKCPSGKRDLILYKENEFISSTESSKWHPDLAFNIKDCHDKTILYTEWGDFSLIGNNINIFDKSGRKIGYAYGNKVIYNEYKIYDNDENLIWSLEEYEFYKIKIDVFDFKHDLSQPEFVFPFIMKRIYNEKGMCQEMFSLLITIGTIFIVVAVISIIGQILFIFKKDVFEDKKEDDNKNNIENPELELNLLNKT